MLLLLLACSPPCEEGQINHPVTGECMKAWSDPSTPDEALAALPECDYLGPGDRIVVDAGCVDDACVGMSLAGISAVLGEGTCEGDAFDGEPIGCAWNNVSVRFEGEAGTYVEDGIATSIAAIDEFDGSSPEGLGLGISLSCYLEVLGEPDDIHYTDTDFGLSPWHTTWDGIGAFTDYFSDDYGQVSSVFLHGRD